MPHILFLSPQPFFQERGTPIAVKLAVSVLAERPDTFVDLLTYHEGTSIPIAGVTHHRIRAPRWLKNIRPGVSVKKLLCDVVFFAHACWLVVTRPTRYTIVHAVEESVFIAWFIRAVFGIPYLYDMDSCLSQQVTEKWRLLRYFRGIAESFERFVVRRALAVVAVCDSLSSTAKEFGAKRVDTLYDVSLLTVPDGASPLDDANDFSEDIRQTVGRTPETLLVLYVGNLERYQGVDLLLESAALVRDHLRDTIIVCIGGNGEDEKRYNAKALALGVAESFRCLGPRPLSQLGALLRQATVVVSPRISGNNTPMKIYSYLHSGVPLLATDLPTHTQVLTPECAVLCAPTPSAFGEGLVTLLKDATLRNKIGVEAKKLAEKRYTFEIFRKKLNSLYNSWATPPNS